ncbi:S46 family peptidase [Xanthomonas citri pv. citri]|uniref:S46 family peptidase n=1 Tax=Xanthomonas citri TaxID=346 RepID=UPI0036DDB7B5
MDAQGKLVGLAFDGNWESVSSNWIFDPAMTRMIAVDGRSTLDHDRGRSGATG